VLFNYQTVPALSAKHCVLHMFSAYCMYLVIYYICNLSGFSCTKCAFVVPKESTLHIIVGNSYEFYQPTAIFQSCEIMDWNPFASSHTHSDLWLIVSHEQREGEEVQCCEWADGCATKNSKSKPEAQTNQSRRFKVASSDRIEFADKCRRLLFDTRFMQMETLYLRQLHVLTVIKMSNRRRSK